MKRRHFLQAAGIAVSSITINSTRSAWAHSLSRKVALSSLTGASANERPFFISDSHPVVVNSRYFDGAIVVVRPFGMSGTTDESTKAKSDFAQGLVLRINERAKKSNASNEVIAVFAKSDKSAIDHASSLLLVEGEISRAPSSGAFLCQVSLYYDVAGEKKLYQASGAEKDKRLFARWSALAVTSRALSDDQTIGADPEGVLGEMASRILSQTLSASYGQGQRFAGDLHRLTAPGQGVLSAAPSEGDKPLLQVTSRVDGEVWCVGHSRKDDVVRWSTVSGAGATTITKDGAPIEVPIPMDCDEVWLVLRDKDSKEAASEPTTSSASAIPSITAGRVQVIECLSGVGDDLGVVRLHNQLLDDAHASWHNLRVPLLADNKQVPHL